MSTTSDPPFPPPSSAEQKPEIQKENTPTPGANYTGDGKIKQRKSAPKALWECNICLETAKEPVITQCGHLYCWPCIHKYVLLPFSHQNFFFMTVDQHPHCHRHVRFYLTFVLLIL